MEKAEKRELKKPITPSCDCCMYYDCDEEGDYYCTMDLDQDEYYAFSLRGAKGCPYFRYYDEYKSVQKQN